ncbi:hypothetical protein Q5O14_01935 [Eubacteriaceae bacterium ES2]|nr:hypothetical protein Q5O14_01935 [Eubacteriaceae bacterium ES2]
MNQTLLARLNELKGMKREVETHMAIYWPIKNKTALKLLMIQNEMNWITEALGVKR